MVSGLPLLSMPPRKIMAILAGAFSYVRPTGCFYQFTYGPRCPVPRLDPRQAGAEGRFALAALSQYPPAAVYRVSRRGPFDQVELAGRSTTREAAPIAAELAAAWEPSGPARRV